MAGEHTPFGRGGRGRHVSSFVELHARLEWMTPTVSGLDRFVTCGMACRQRWSRISRVLGILVVLTGESGRVGPRFHPVGLSVPRGGTRCRHHAPPGAPGRSMMPTARG